VIGGKTQTLRGIATILNLARPWNWLIARYFPEKLLACCPVNFTSSRSKGSRVPDFWGNVVDTTPPMTRYLLLLASPWLASAQDTLGLANGYMNLRTANFEIQLVRDAQTLASLRPTGSNFDFLPFDYLPRRARNGQYHWGDLTVRYRAANTSTSTWADANSAASRKPVSLLRTSSISAANLAPTLPTSTPLNVSREWLDIFGDLGLRFTLTNTAKMALELGSLGFPAEFNSILTGRTADQIQQRCSFTDPYIGMHAGYLRVTPVRGTGPALLVTPLGDTPFEAWRNLAEPSFSDTGYGSQTFEGLYEWQTLTAGWAAREWAAAEPWNPPSSRVLQPGESLSVGLRFSLAKNGVRDIDTALVGVGIPVVAGVPGYVVPRGVPAQLLVRMPANLTVVSTRVHPPGSLIVLQVKNTTYQITPDLVAWGRARLSLAYSDGRVQTVHYWITKAADETVSDLGRFLTTRQWFNDTTDPFGRAPSIMSYDYENRAIVVQDNRVWIAGLSDEGGAGSFLAAAIKQAVQPQAQEVAKLEEFVDRVLWGRLQNADYSVRKSLFFYQPSLVPGFSYANDVDWSSWMSWDRSKAYLTDRAYNYVHVVATYWALYRAGRAHPGILSRHTWDWYLDQAHSTVIRCMTSNVGYSRDGLMGETVLGELLQDLIREGRTTQATSLEASMRTRARQWDASSNPYGSEMSWDSTGQEGVYYWSRFVRPTFLWKLGKRQF